jgi:hypothetical protein
MRAAVGWSGFMRLSMQKIFGDRTTHKSGAAAALAPHITFERAMYFSEALVRATRQRAVSSRGPYGKS